MLLTPDFNELVGARSDFAWSDFDFSRFLASDFVVVAEVCVSVCGVFEVLWLLGRFLCGGSAAAAMLGKQVNMSICRRVLMAEYITVPPIE